MAAPSARAFLLLIVIAAGAGLLAFFAWVLAPAPSPPPPEGEIEEVPPDPLAFDPGGDFADDVEDAVFEVEDTLRDLARQIRDGAAGGVAYHLDDSFEGTALFGLPVGFHETVDGVEIREGELKLPRLSRDAFREWVAGIRPHRIGFKVATAELNDETLSVLLKVEGERRSKDLIELWKSEGPAVLAIREDRWQLVRFEARRGRTETGKRRFIDVTEPLGLKMFPTQDARTGSRVTFGRLFIGGIAAGDADGDGDIDLYVPRVGLNVLFRNDGGKFVDAAPQMGVADPNAGSSALFLDGDNDGDLDLFVANYEPPMLPDAVTGKPASNRNHRALSYFRNEGERYTDMTVLAGLRSHGPATMACAADVDGDGDLDVYVCKYRDDAKDDPDRPEEVPADVFNARNGEPNQLWINQGDGRFAEEAGARGVADTGWSLAAAFADYDADGDADLYVANDYGGNRLYRNRGDGTFEDVTEPSGVADTGFGMGVTWFDADADGDLDLYVSNMYSTAGKRILSREATILSEEQARRLGKMAGGNTLLLNKGDGTFEDVTSRAGVGRAGWAWSSEAYDYDNNGVPDLYVANGFRTSAFTTTDL